MYFGLIASIFLNGHSQHVKKMNESSIIIVGMRGAGKTTCGRIASKVLGWPVMDLDHLLEAEEGKTCGVIVKESGWTAFRAKEEALLKKTVNSNLTKTVISCGGGVVESDGATEFLKSVKKTLAVVHVRRDIDDIVAYLEGTEKSTAQGEGQAHRPNYAGGASIKSVWDRRKPLFDIVSSHEVYFGQLDGEYSREADIARFFYLLKNAVTPNVVVPNAAFAEWKGNAEGLEGYDAVVYSPQPIVNGDGYAFTKEISAIRKACTLPIVVSVSAGDVKGMECATRTCVEYLLVDDIDEDMLRNVVSYFLAASTTRVILSKTTEAASKEKDFVDLCKLAKVSAKIIGIRLVVADPSFALGAELFAMVSQLKGAHLPSHITGVTLECANSNKTVLCNLLSVATGPSFRLELGKESELVQRLEIDQVQHYCLFGKPIQSSPSPTLHNTGFKFKNLLKEYTLCETDDARKVASVIHSHRFQGASVTIPLKEAVMPLMTELTDAATAIGAVNTIIRIGSEQYRGDNTDWLGMYNLLKTELTGDLVTKNALVVGAGGTSFAACYCAKQFGMNLYVYNRTHSKAQTVAERFGGKAIADLNALESVDVVLSTVPSTSHFELPKRLLNTKPVVLDAAYRPRNTKLLIQASKEGCKTFAGIQMLVEQGLEQFERWTNIKAPRTVIEKNVYEFYGE